MSVINFYSRSGPQNRPLWRFNLGQNRNEALQLTFGYLTYSQLRRCMLVSKVWRKLALEELQVRCSVRISNEEHAKIVLQKFKTCSNFRVGNLTINGISVDLPLLDQCFLKAQLTLHFLRLESPVQIRETTLFKILWSLPNLTHLSITTFHNPPESTHQSSLTQNENPFRFPVLSGRYWVDEELSKQAQEDEVIVQRNIRHLHLDLGQEVTFQLTKIFHAFPNLYELAIANVTAEPRRHFKFSPAFHPLRHLSLRQYSNASFPEKLVQTLMRLNMHLEKLELIFHPPSSSQSLQSSCFLLRQFIESQGESLQFLKLAQVEDDLSWFWQHNSNSSTGNATHVKAGMNENAPFPTSSPGSVNYSWNFNYSTPSISLLPMSLPNVRILHVQKPLITNLAQVLNHFPQLRELSVQVSHGSNWKGMLPAKLEPHRNITRLKIDFIDSESFSRLGCCLPSLQTLQLTYCDKSLFNVLADFIPFFNKGGSSSKITKENIFSCHQCHGITEEVSYEHRNNDGLIQNNESFMKGTGVVDSSFDRRSFPNNLEPVEATLEPKQRRKHVLKLLTRLRIRSCAHLPFENFVFLQRERHKQGFNSNFTGPTPENGNFDETFENDVDGPQETFSWTTLGMLKSEEFADLPLRSSDDTESCSSA